MSKLVLSLSCLILISCTAKEDSPTSSQNVSPEIRLSPYELQVVSAARDKIAANLISKKTVPTGQKAKDQEDASHILKSHRVDSRTYDASKSAYDRFQKSVFPTLVKASTCQSISDPDPSNLNLLRRDLYTKASAELIEVTNELTSPDAIFDFVRFQIKNEILFGASRTAARTLRVRSGTAVDKANLLAAMFREASIPSYFIEGEIYLKESLAKRLFQVRDIGNLFFVIYAHFGNHFLTSEGAFTDLYRYVNGETYWAIPHMWVRAYHDGSWHNYDPTELMDPFDSLGDSGYLSNTVSLDWNSWFFLPDANGAYVKPRSIIDALYQLYSPSRENRYLDLSGFGAEERYSGVLSNLPPCSSSPLYGIQDTGFEFRANVTVKDLSSNIKFSYEGPVALFSENESYLSHSAGLLGNITTPTAGNVEFKIGDDLVAAFASTTGTAYRVSAGLNGPSNWSYIEFNDEFAQDYNSGDVFNFNIFAGKVGSLDVNQAIDGLIEGITENEAPKALMAKMLRLAGTLFQFKESRNADDIYRLRRFRDLPTTLTGTYTKGGIVAVTGEDDKEFGSVPLSGGIDARLPGYILTTDSSIYGVEGKQTLKLATEELLVAGSDAEATIWEDLFGVRGYSANRVLQLGAKLRLANPLTYNLIDGEVFNDTSNAHITSQITNPSAFYTQWITNIEPTYGDGNGTFWAMNKEITDPDGQAKAWGFIVFRKTIFDEGIAGFKVEDYGHSSVLRNPVGNINVDQTNSNTFPNPIELVRQIAQDPGIFGGGSSNYSEDQDIPDDGESFQNGSAPRGSVQIPGSCNPVDFATGRMWHTLTDFNLRGRTLETGLQFRRTYFTLKQYETTGSWVDLGDFGKGWVHTYDTRLLSGNKDASGYLTMGAITASLQSVTWISPEGNPVLFTNTAVSPATDPVFEAPDGFIGTLTVTTNTYVLTLKGNLKYIFKRDLGSNYHGRLISIEEPHGETVALTYDGNGRLNEVSTPLAGSLVFTRDGNGRVTKISNAKNNLSTAYTFSGGKLSTSSDFDGNVTKYEYNSGQVGTRANGLLSAIVDPLNRRLEFEYYQNGKVYKEKDHGGAIQSYQYAPYLYERYTRVTSPSGYTTEFRYDDKFRIIEIVYPDGGRKVQKWNSDGRIESEKDPAGFTTLYTYDSRGNRTGVKRPMDSSYRQAVYNSTFDKVTSITPLAGSPSTFTLDSQTGDVVQQSRMLGATNVTIESTYDSFGTRLTTTTNLNSFSNIADPNGLTIFEFDSRNPQELSYDSRSRIKERKFKNGRIIRYTYDKFDRTTFIEDTHGPDISNKYDIAGRLIQTGRTANGVKHTASFEYDDRDRMIASVNYAGERTEYKYDLVGVGCVLMDKPTKIITADGKSTRYEYDFAGRKSREFLPNGDQILYKYNLRGDLIAVIDPSGQITQYEYDGNGRMTNSLAQSAVTESTPYGHKIAYGAEDSEYFYDAADRLIRVEQKLADEYRSNGKYVTEFTYDDHDRVIRKQIRHKRGSTVFEEFDDITFSYLNVLGLDLMTFVGNKNVNLHFSYQTQPPYTLISFRVVPTAFGSTLGIKEASFRVTPDMNGPMAQIERAGEILVRNGYDQAGRLLNSSGRLAGYSHSVSLGYDGFGRRTSVSNSNGLIGSYTFDNADRATSIGWLGAGISKSESITYNPAGLVSEVSREIGTFNYGYSANNEIGTIAYSGSESLSNSYVNTNLLFDRAGNITQYRGNQFSVFNNFAYAINDVIGTKYWPDGSGLGHVGGIKSNVATKSNEFFPDGQLKEFKRTTDGGETFAAVARFYYDGLGRRIAKVSEFSSETNTKTTYTHLGLENKILLADVGTEFSNTEALYVDGGSIDDHLFQVNSSVGSKAYAKDHLGSILNSSALGGKSVYGLFGENLGTAPPLSSVDEPVIYGYSGREFDSETGYYYYRARYFDPQSARFLSKDPAGLASGDTNPYRYVLNSPINIVDPLGLWGVCVSAGGAAAISNDPNSNVGSAWEAQGGLVFGTNNGSLVAGGMVSTGTGSSVVGVAAGVGVGIGFMAGDVVSGASTSTTNVLGIISVTIGRDLQGNFESLTIGLGGHGGGLSSYTTNTNTEVRTINLINLRP